MTNYILNNIFINHIDLNFNEFFDDVSYDANYIILSVIKYYIYCNQL